MKDFIKDVKIILTIFIIGCFVGVLLSSLIYIKVRSNEINDLGKKVDMEYCLYDSLDYNCIQNHLEKHRIKFSRIVLAQIKLESNNLKSNLVKTNKNILGMRIAAQRFTFAINSHDYGAFAKYETIEDCILDLKSWQIQQAFYITTEEEYFNLLSKVYCTDANYVNRLKQLINGK